MLVASIQLSHGLFGRLGLLSSPPKGHEGDRHQYRSDGLDRMAEPVMAQEEHNVCRETLSTGTVPKVEAHAADGGQVEARLDYDGVVR